MGRAVASQSEGYGFDSGVQPKCPRAKKLKSNCAPVELTKFLQWNVSISEYHCFIFSSVDVTLVLLMEILNLSTWLTACYINGACESRNTKQAHPCMIHSLLPLISPDKNFNLFPQ